MAIKGRVLVIAGSDCSGGAGLEADQKVLAAHQCYAMTATTALTVQSTQGVKRIHVVPGDFVAEQVSACIDDIGVDVVKTGMLASAETVRIIAALLANLKHKVPILVVDPVTVSTSGARLLPAEALREMTQHLLPQTTILTPNLPEALALLDNAEAQQGEGEVRSVGDLERVARGVKALGPRWVLVKGGHLPLREDLTAADKEEKGSARVVVDVLVGPGGEVMRFKSPWQETRSTHGTGCSLASAIAANLAQGTDMVQAVRAACRYVECGIRGAPSLGAGNGPLDHFHSLSRLPFSRGYFVDYVLEHPAVKDVWAEYVSHPFVLAMGRATLPIESFKDYIIQDYLYLIQFARAHALAACKTQDAQEIAKSSQIVCKITTEMNLHLNYCEGFGISKAQILATPEHPACVAYARYFLDIGQREDWFALQMALAPCLLGYGAAAQALKAREDTVRQGNVYWNWIEEYAGAEYIEAMRLGAELLERHAVQHSPSRIEELIHMFARATKLEVGFWNMFPYE